LNPDYPELKTMNSLGFQVILQSNMLFWSLPMLMLTTNIYSKLHFKYARSAPAEASV